MIVEFRPSSDRKTAGVRPLENEGVSVGGARWSGVRPSGYGWCGRGGGIISGTRVHTVLVYSLLLSSSKLRKVCTRPE